MQQTFTVPVGGSIDTCSPSNGFQIAGISVDNHSSCWLCIGKTEWVPPYTIGWQSVYHPARSAIDIASFGDPTGTPPVGATGAASLVTVYRDAIPVSRGSTYRQDVAIINTPDVNLPAGTAVNISGPVTLAAGTTVTIGGTPTVNVNGIVNVAINGTPTVNVNPVTIANGTVNIGNTPAVTVSSGTINIGNSPTVSISGPVSASITGPVTIENAPGTIIQQAGLLGSGVGVDVVTNGAGNGTAAAPLAFTPAANVRALVIFCPPVPAGATRRIVVATTNLGVADVTVFDRLLTSTEPEIVVAVCIAPWQYSVSATVSNATPATHYRFSSWYDSALPVSGISNNGGPLDVRLTGPVGQQAMAASLPVVLASNQSAIPVNNSPGGNIALLNSGVRTASTDSPDIINTGYSGYVAILNVTANPGGAETLGLEMRVSGVTLCSFGTLFTAANGAKLVVATGGPASTDYTAGIVAKAVKAPGLFRLRTLHSGAGGWNYTLTLYPLM